MITFPVLFMHTGGTLGSGYAMGGYTGSSRSSEIDGILFSTNSAVNPSAALSVARLNLMGVNSETRGYALGGEAASGNSSEIDGIQFSDESAINPSAALPEARAVAASVNSTTRGYVLGGYPAGLLSTMRYFRFDTEVAGNLSATLSVGRQSMAGVNSNAKGYALGGSGGTGVNYADIDGLQFSTETAINPSSVLSVARGFAASANSTTRGYAMGGAYDVYNGEDWEGVRTAEIDGIIFDTEAATNPSASLPDTCGSAVGVNSQTSAYVMGGYRSAAASNKITSWLFEAGTATDISATLSVARHGQAGVQSGGIL